MKWKLRLLIIFNHIAALSALIFVRDIGSYLLIPMGVLLIGKLGGEAGFHRYFAHRSFLLNRFWQWVVLGLGSLNGIGSPVSWAISHRAHHQYSDTDGDPHGKMSAFRVWLTMWKPARLRKNQLRDFLNDGPAVWYHRNYHRFYFTVFLALAVVDWYLPLLLISVPAVITFHSAGLVNVFCHGWGYRNHATGDSSTNNLWVNFVTLGSGLHNNHHHSPESWNNSEHWYEWDLVAVMIRLIVARPQAGSVAVLPE